jgi:hypothetical protein
MNKNNQDSLTGMDNDQPVVGFFGKNIRLEVFSPTLDDPVSLPMDEVVSDRVEFNDLPENETNGANLIDVEVNVNNTSILFDYSDSAPSKKFSSGRFNGYVFSDKSNSLPAIKDVSINEAVTTLGITSEDISFTKNSIKLNVEGLEFNPDTFAKLDIEFFE